MRRVSASLLLFYYSFGQVVLPEGNFAYLQQIPDLYHEFAALNDDSDVDDFFEEQFFDLDRFLGDEGDDNDPSEKEAKQVPFHTLPFIVANYCTACDGNTMHPPTADKKGFSSFYLLTDYCIDTAPIFHPPKSFSV